MVVEDGWTQTRLLGQRCGLYELLTPGRPFAWLLCDRVRSPGMKTEPTVGEFWRASVIAGIRSKFGAIALALMLGVAAWQFASGNVRIGLIVLAITVLTYARIPVAIGAMIGARQRGGASTSNSPRSGPLVSATEGGPSGLRARSLHRPSGCLLEPRTSLRDGSPASARRETGT